MRKKIWKKLVSSFLVVSMFVSFINIVGATEKAEDTKMEVLSSIDDSNTTIPTENKTGYIDAGIEYDRIPNYVAFDNGGYDKATVIPSSYSSVDKGYVTSVKDQNPWGTCWAHAAVAAMESYALSHGVVKNPEDINLSEFALAYLTFNDEERLLDETGDYSYIDNMDTAFNAGGNDEMSYKALSNGLALYNDDEVQYKQSQNSWVVPEIQWDEENISYVLTGQKYINIEDREQVKAAVMENGAVTTSYFSDGKYYNNAHLYNYNYEYYGTNHAVAIVGWDDNKSKELFAIDDGTTIHTPENDGAWLIKNSWGTYWGDNGYIWISYEDWGILSSGAVVYEIAPKEDYQYLYQHDGATVAHNTVYGYSFASVFEVQNEKERVNALSFFTYSTQAQYTAYLYDNSNGMELDKGELVATTSGITTYAGYYTVDFDTDYVFMKGDKFTVIVEFDTYSSMIYAASNQTLSKVGNAYSTCLEGQSYVEKYADSGFEDVAELGGCMNISLKAHSIPLKDKNAPTKIKEAKFIGNEQVTISWVPVENAVSYELWKSNSESGINYKVITGITDTTYIDKTIAGSTKVEDMVKYGETYCYKVRAVFLDGSKNEYCQLKKVEIKPEKTNVNVNVDDNKLKITWDELDYVDGYNIYIGLNYKENIVHVGDVVGNITSYIYDEWLEYYADYYIVVEPYVYNGQGTKICAEYDIVDISVSIKQAEMVDSHYLVEDTIYLEWKWLYGNLGDEVRVDLFCNGVSAGSIKLEMTDTSYVLDVSMFEPGDLLQVRCSVYYEISHGTNAVSEFYYDYFTIGDIFDGEVYWYVKDNQIYVYMPNANAAAYEIYYGYDKSKADFSNMVEVTKDEIEAGYPLPIDICPITGSNIGVRITPYLANQVIPKELIKVGGIYVEPLLQMIPNVRVTSLEKSVKLQALIGNKVEGFNYEYQWYVSDSKTGMATAINDATSAEYVAYVGDTESKYYYCQITCKYNGEKVYTTVNENGERTRVMGKDCFDNVTISNIKAQNYTGSAITPTITVKEDNTKLVQGTHYEVSYENNINAGTAIAKITFLGAYSAMGMKEKEFVINPMGTSSLTVGAISNQEYTGAAIKPKVSVKNGSTILVLGTDYTVNYSNNLKVGTANVIITFKGNYKGECSTTFNIVYGTGMYKGPDGQWYYYTNGKIDTSYVGIAQNAYGCWYINKGKLDTTYTGLVKDKTDWVYVSNGKLDTTYIGLVKYKSNWVYVNKGKLDVTYTGLVKYKTNWVYVVEGKLNTTYTGLVKYKDSWVYVSKGKLDTTYTGMSQNEAGWWYVSKGKLDATYTGLVKYKTNWVYVVEGKLNTTYTGLVKYNSTWVYVRKGKLDATYTGMAKNQYGWWYVTKGKLDLTFTGIADNAYGTWYLQNGELDLTFSGKVNINGKQYTVKKGKVVK